jgi:nicotinamide-nucleotide amidase
MIAEIISIGEELLIGQTVNTNAAWLSRNLNTVGITVRQIVVITDNHDDILNTISQAIQRADLVLTTGGLGPTRDDITKKALCELFDSKLVVNQTVMSDNKHFFEKRGYELTELNKLQALVPDKAQIIRNPYGTAPGLWFEQNNTILISMPGVPHEMQHMMNDFILPALKGKVNDYYIIHKSILTQGIGESFLAEIIAAWEEQLPEFITLAYLPSPGMVKLRLTGKGTDKKIIESAIEDEIKQLQAIIPQYIWGFDDQRLEELIGKMLSGRSYTVCTAESCTGGYISHKLTSVPGSSAYYKGSVIVYSNQAKQKLLSIDKGMLLAYGAVSQEVVEVMAINALKLFDTDYSLAISGIAGPSGGSPGKPVGTVWIAVACKHEVISRIFSFGDTRERNIIRAGVASLSMLKELIEKRF